MHGVRNASLHQKDADDARDSTCPRARRWLRASEENDTDKKLPIRVSKENDLYHHHTCHDRSIFNVCEDVDFCGYTVPHPAESKMHFRIQSREIPALEILKRGLKDLQRVCDHTIDLFEKEVKDFTRN
ncbi:unnamed protein product [Diatraea saccharalis]|uniref:DNA-directed RNA polymerase RBP11-like dimerisation domain-containing protein n=1 Tax=Diatraea saccharalis TaxID=40085 RepID=A0A9N9WEN8_9NEOP|nr:unnamed protein product [Diatraea saccharalis]